MPIPSLATLKLIAIGVVAVLLVVAGFIGGYRWELATYRKLEAKQEAAQAQANAAELKLQQTYDAIGAKDEADYLSKLAAIEAETQRLLAAMPKPAGSRKGRHHAAASGSGIDPASIVGLLRDASRIANGASIVSSSPGFDGTGKTAGTDTR